MPAKRKRRTLDSAAQETVCKVRVEMPETVKVNRMFVDPYHLRHGFLTRST